jgi:phosphatidate cytidylyltransferase
VELTWSELTVTQLLLLVIPANLLGQLGDLAESLIKRAHGVKDSGTIIYGHGGMLDRIDALIFAGPWVYYCAVVLF